MSSFIMSFGWVTFAASDDDVQNVLLLLNSLRSVYTSHKVLVIVGKCVSSENIGRIRHFADFVTHLQTIPEWDGFPDVAARLQCWTFPGFSRLIFLEAKSVILQNVDNLFSELKEGVTGVGTDGDDFIIALEPSFEFYQRITSALKQSCPASEVRKSFQIYLQETGNCQKLNSKYNFYVGGIGYTSGSLESVINVPSIAIIHDSAIQAGYGKDKSIVKDILQYRGQLLECNNRFFSNNICPTVRPNLQSPEPIAVVGVSCRFPNSNSMEEFWELLISGEHGIRPCPPDRWTTEQGCIVEDPAVEVGFLKCPVDEIDASFFGFNPMELKYTDPQQRLLLEVAHEALEDAGISATSLESRRVGVFTATWQEDYKELMIESGFKGTEFFRTYVGNAFSASSARLSHVLGVTGPNIATESGCSASFGAVREASQALHSGDAELCIASAVSLILHPFKHEDMKAVASPDYRCKTFDSKANGFARSEGVASLVLKRLSDAVRAGDRVYGLIRGMGVTQEGTSSSMGTPTVEGEAVAMQLALNEAQVDPSEIDYLEAHGTGTAVGDPIEVNAITKAYASVKPRDKPLQIASVKTNIGHTEAAAGMASIIKTLLAFKHEILPPHINVADFNPNCDFTRIPATVPLVPTPWKRTPARKRIAGISNFGISGGDMHMILEEPPAQLHCQSGRRNIFNFPSPSWNVVTLSAKTRDALHQGLGRLEAAIHSNPSLILDDIAYTLNTGRSHYKQHRVSLVVKDAVSIPGAIAKKIFCESPIPSKDKPRIAFMFPGQGTQYTGMGLELSELSPVFRHHFDHCCRILLLEHEFDLKTAIWTNPKPDWQSPLVSQVAIFVVEYALVQLWKSLGIVPNVVVGHSLGEFAAAVTAGVMSLRDSIKLIVSRCRLVSELAPGGMAVVQKNEVETKDLLQDFQKVYGHELDIAAINSPSQTAVAGSATTIKDFITYCNAIGVTAVQLNSTVAYHSRCLDAILDKFAAVAETVEYSTPDKNCTFLSSVTGLSESHADFGPNYWVNQTRNCVQFQKTAKNLVDQADVFLEVGPHPILSPLLLANMRSADTKPITLPSIKRDVPAWETLTTSLSKLYCLGVDVDWEGYHKFLPGDKIALPFYAFQRKKYWFSVKEGHRRGHMTSNVKKDFPLIGSELSTPLSSFDYVNYLSLKTVPYVAHHKIGEHAVFPGAAYVEMFLETATKFGFPPVVLNIRFRAPLVLTEDGVVETHTVFSPDSGKAQIFCRSSKSTSWVCHAEAELSAETPNTVPKQETTDIISGMDVKSESTALYTRLKSLGYNFDIQFQTIVSVSSNQSKEFLIEITVPNLNEGHICHPITIDAVMQSFVVTCTEDFNSLHLPSGIAHFEILAPPRGHLKYVHIMAKSVQLLDSELNVIAIMRGMETMPSTLEKIQAALDGGFSSRIKTTPLLEEQWIPVPTATSFLNRFSNLVSQEGVKLVEHEANVEEILALNQGIGRGIMIELKELGWDTIPNGAIINAESVIKKFGLITVSPSHKIVNRLMEILAEEGILWEMEGGKGFKVLKQLPSQETLTKEVKSCRGKSPHLLKEWGLSDLYLANLVPILKGKVNALELLFPSAGSNTSAETFYLEAESSNQLNSTLQTTINALIEKSASVWESGKQIQILEIGAGTGSATSVILPLLEKADISFSYTYTDISSAYFAKAEAKFSRWRDSLIFKTFNVEEDPEAQGFPPNYYHLVVASNVLHATIDLTETVVHTRSLLRKWGLLLLAETFTPQRHYDITVGHLDGYWRYKDLELRPSHCTVTQLTWHSLLAKVGFTVVTSTSVYNGGLGVICAEADDRSTIKEGNGRQKSWIMLSNGSSLADNLNSGLTFQGRRVVVVHTGSCYKKLGNWNFQILPGSKCDIKQVFDGMEGHLEGVIYMFGIQEGLDMSDVWKCYLSLTQELASRYKGTSPKLLVLTRGLFHAGDQSPVFPVASTLSGITRSFLTEFPHFTAKIIDLDPDSCIEDKQISSTTADIISTQIWSPTKGNCKEALIAIREGVVLHARIRQRPQTAFPPLPLPKQPFCLELPKTNSISDLKFKPFTPPELEPHQVEVQIRAIGLNFRDIFIVFRALDPKSVAVGSDVAGIVTKVGRGVSKVQVGDAVFGARSSLTPFPSVAIMGENQLLHLPEHLTFEEAVTYPVTYSSAYYGLVMLAGLKKGDNVLIHTATGGVGLRAIELAFEAGATVFATAGSKRKRAYLKSIGVSEDHIFSSRETNFSEKILALGKGQPMIDIVLNSLTGHGFKEASLSVCRKSAKFVELGRINIWSEEEMKVLRPDVSYFALDLSESAHLSEIWHTILTEMKRSIRGTSCKPLPITHFQAENVRDAMTYLQKAKHIGKIVCSFPETLGGTESPIFNERSAYLIAGGLGGIGLKVVEWMVSKGAKHIVLTGRNKPTPEAVAAIQAINSGTRNASIITESVDVSSYQEVSMLLQNLASRPALPIVRGIMNCAGALSDGGLLEQNTEKYEIVFKSKISGSWNLHELTKHLPLEHFVLFSSFAAIAGTPGQSNHAAANAFQDALSAFRHNSGLPSTCINWGQWGEAGVVVGRKIHGYTPMPTSACLASLETLLREHSPNALAVDGTHSVWKSLFPWTESYFKPLFDVSSKSSGPAKKNKTTGTDSFWQEIDEVSPDGSDQHIQSVVKSHILTVLVSLLDHAPDDIISDKDLGMDSLMKIELRNSLQELVGPGVVIPNTLSSCTTLDQLTSMIVELVAGKNIKKLSSRTAKKTSFANIVHEEVTLALTAWNGIKPSIKPNKPVTQIQTVLLTGTTGNLGPYVLLQLTQRPHIKTVICLVQARDDSAAMERLILHLRHLDVLSKVDMSKVKVIAGRLGQPHFGLMRSTFDFLTTTVEAIFNCAAATSHVEEYLVSQDNSLRQVNVIGVNDILLFATTGQAKYVFHASSLGTLMRSATSPEGHKVMQEGWTEDDEFDDAPNFGYIVSKFVGDKVVQAVMEKFGSSFPVKVFRFPLVSGCSTNGRQDVRKSNFFLKYLYYFKTGIMPRDDVPVPLLPVDQCASISLAIFFNDAAPSDVYNVVNPNVPSELELPTLAQKLLGRDGSMKLVDYEEWVELMSKDKTCLLGPLKHFYMDPKCFPKWRKMEMIEGWKSNKVGYYRSRKVERYIKNFDSLVENPIATLERDMVFALKEISNT